MEWLSNSLGLSTSAVVPDHWAPSLRNIPEAVFDIPSKFLTSQIPYTLRGRLPDAPDDQPQQAAAASSPAPAIPEAKSETPPSKFLTSLLHYTLQQAAAASSPAPANASAVPGTAAAASSSAATAAAPQEPLPGPPAASDGGHNGNDQSILEKRRRQCSKVLTTPGLDNSMYLKYVNRLDFDDAVELLGQSARLADGVKRMVEQRIDDMTV